FPRSSMNFENSETLSLIYLINFSIGCCIVTITSLFAIPLYIRILSSKWFFENNIFRLIVINGVVSLFEFFSYVLALSIGRIPNINVFIDFLNDSHLNVAFAFLFLYATSAQFLSNLCISLNRLMYITK
ncbi:hypothetical protein PMAYCL1PPCAC_21579, partial [Pristionchus mayeri]